MHGKIKGTRGIVVVVDRSHNEDGDNNNDNNYSNNTHHSRRDHTQLRRGL